MRRGERGEVRGVFRWHGVGVVPTALVFALVLTGASEAATINVTTTADTNSSSPVDLQCSLREAVIAANSNLPVGACPAGGHGLDTIVLPAGTYGFSIGGQGEDASETGDLDVRESLEIVGAGATSTIIDAHALDRIIEVPVSHVALTLRGITLRGGSVSAGQLVTTSAISVEGQFFTSPLPPGGGFDCTQCELTLEDSVVTANPGGSGAILLVGGANAAIRRTTVSASAGTGIALYFASATLEDSSVDGNSGDGIGAGPGLATIERSTITNNGQFGVAAYLWSQGMGVTCGSATIRNSTISGNSVVGAYSDSSCSVSVESTTIVAGGPNSAVTFGNVVMTNTLAVGLCVGGASQQGGNLESPGNTCGFNGPGDQVNVADPKIGPLAMNGGLTKTHALLAGSPAIGHGNDAACPATDQRGVTRPAPAGGHCDVGSYEYNTGCGASLEATGAAPLALLLARRRRRSRR